MKKFLPVICFMLLLLCAACQSYSYDDEYINNKTASELDINDIFDGFDSVDIYGESVDDSIFAEHKLTLVNIWTTWCPPCKEELPSLQEIAEKYADHDVVVVGILADAADSKTAEALPKKISSGVKLMENAGADYTQIVPDESLMNGILRLVTAYPTSFFVDSEGNIIEKAVYFDGREAVVVDSPFLIGSRDAAGWAQVIDFMLAEISYED